MLNGDTVSYGSAIDLRETLEYDFSQERAFRYKGLTMAETVHHLTVFISRLWQIHAFGEGNTRTTAVFFIKYLRQLGFEADNALFAEHSWYFRNSLVRANYNNFKIGIFETTEYLEKFLRNLLLKENNALHNREMHVSGIFAVMDDPVNEMDDPVKRKNDPVNDPEKSRLTDRERQMIELLRDNPGITRKKMAEQIGCSEATIKRILKNLVSKEIVRRIGSDKKGEWIIMK